MEYISKVKIRNERYYIGYKYQNYTTLTKNNQIVAKWNSKTNSFWYMEKTGIGKIDIKNEIFHIEDIDNMNEIEIGFYPIKEVFPKEEYLVD